MDAEPFVQRVLDDEGICADLDEAEAMALLRWLTGQVRQVVETARSEEAAWQQVDALCRRARQAARLVASWRDAPGPKVVEQASRAGFRWPAGSIPSATALLNALLASPAD